MGCDIHLHIEVRLNKRWEHHSEIDVNRDYALFGKIANVREDNNKPLAEDRGLPEDINPMTARLIETAADHSYGYLLPTDITKLRAWSINHKEHTHGFQITDAVDNLLQDPLMKDYRLIFGFDS